jgi:hypothetical protein
MMAAGDDGGRAEAEVTARRAFSASSRKKFDKLEAQAALEPADRTAGKIVAGGLLVGLGGALAFAAMNGYLSTPTLR